LIENRPELVNPLIEVLRGAAFDVEVGPPDAIPDRADELNRFSLLILSNVPAARLTPGRMEAMRKYVEQRGGGLIAIGGDQSFTAGGYRNSALESVLPVASEPLHERPKPSLALVLVLDQSGSMEGESMALAKRAARQAVELLGPRDQVGVLVFEDSAHWASEIRPCVDKKPVLERIDAIAAGGGTNMLPAMERAFLALEETRADLKHVILMTDGASSPGDFEGLARRMNRSGITVSTVGVGPDVIQPLLEDIAREGKGRYYYCENAATVPRVFVEETKSAGKPGIFEGTTFVKTPAAADVLAEKLHVADGPALTGYVETRPLPSAHEVWRSDRGDPLLVWRQCGKGKSVALLTDMEGRWSSSWPKWKGFGPLWVELAHFAMREEPADRAIFSHPSQTQKLPNPHQDDGQSSSIRRAIGNPKSEASVSPRRETPTPDKLISRQFSLRSILLTLAILMYVVDLALKRIDLSPKAK
jgi:Mg-chelatase subunit ChlD